MMLRDKGSLADSSAVSRLAHLTWLTGDGLALPLFVLNLIPRNAVRAIIGDPRETEEIPNEFQPY